MPSTAAAASIWTNYGWCTPTFLICGWGPEMNAIIDDMMRSSNDSTQTQLLEALNSLLIRKLVSPQKETKLSRTISLINFLPKHSMHRLYNFLGDFECLPIRSYVYRKHKITSTCLNQLLLHITSEKLKKLYISAISFDFQNATRR